MLGIALINVCIENQVEVLAIIRKNSFNRNRIPLSELVTILECDLSEMSSYLLDDRIGYDAFYHFAWECTDNISRNNVVAQSRNISYTLDAVKFSHLIGCKKFIGVGSQAEYGRVSGIITPNEKVNPDSAYGTSKYAASRLSGILCEQMGIDFIWTRVFSTYGVNDMPSTMIMYCIEQLLKGEKPKLTKCEQIWDYLNCNDAGNAFYLIGDIGKSQTVYHIGSGKARPLLEYIYIIRDIIDKNLPVGIGEREYAANQVMYLCPDISRLENDTGFIPKISFEQGIAETIDWYRGMKKL